LDAWLADRDGGNPHLARRIVAEAGVGKQTIYRHFRSKEALVEAMCAPEVVRMAGLGRLFWEAGPRQVRIAIAQLWAEEHSAETAPVVAEQLVQLALGDAYQELVLGTGRPRPEVFERQIDAALALVGLAFRQNR
jgi:AcrR family transcriptional regulator